MFLGTQYYRQPNPPPEDWERDLAHIRSLGLSVVRLWLPWSWFNSAPNEWDWALADRFFDLAHQNGLRVLAQLTLECMPSWWAAVNPSAQYLDENGQPWPTSSSGYLSVGGQPGPCYDAALAQAAAADYITQVVGRYAQHPALFAWDIWNEVNPIASMGRDLCWCPATLAVWRQWLAERYGEVAALNAAWQRRFRSFDEVPLLTRAHYLERLDQQRFAQERAAGWMRWRAARVRAIDPNHRIVSHLAGGTLTAGYVTEDWLLADSLDTWGTSIYRRDYFDVSRKFDLVRSASGGRPWWLSEVSGGRGTQGGQYHFLSDNVKTPAETRSYPLLAFSHGAEGVIFWQFRCERFSFEAPNFGLTNQAGDPTERTVALAELTQALAQHGDVFEHLEFGSAEVGILVDYDAFGIERVAYWEQQREPLGMEEIAGYHRALTEEGFRVDILNARVVVADGVPAGLRLLIYPYPVVDRPGLAVKLASWVESSGTLVVGPACGLYDERTYANPVVPPSPWRELLGVRQHEFRYPAEPAVVLAHGALAPGQSSLMGRKLIETYHVEDAEVLGALGAEPALTRRRHGAGWAYTLGSYFGAAYQAEPGPGLRAMVVRLAEEAGITRALSCSSPCFLRTARAGSRVVAFVHNPTDRDQISWLVASADVGGRVFDPLSNQEVGWLTATRPLAVPIPARDTRVLFIGE